MDISTLAKMQENLKKVANTIVDQEDLLIVPLVKKMQKLAERYPTDPTVVGVYRFLVKRAQDNAMVIKRADLRDAYDAFKVSHSVAPKYLVDELRLPHQPTGQKSVRASNEGTEIDLSKYINSDLTEQLGAVINTASYRPFTAEIAKRATQTCIHELSCFGKELLPNNITVVAGDADLLICRASYNTVKGECSILIPIEVRNNCAMVPASFVTPEGFQTISGQNIYDYLQKHAGKVVYADANKLLKYCKAMRLDDDAVDRAVMMASAKEADAALSILASAPVEEPVKQDPELQSIASMLGSVAGSAEFTLGKQAVSVSRTLVANKLHTLGYKKADITITDFDKENILFAVGIGKYAFKVPVYLKEGKAILSDVIIANGSMHEFSTRGFAEMFKVGEVDIAAMVKSAQIDTLAPSEVVGVVRQAMIEGNYERAVASLEWLKQSKDDRAYATAFEVYKQGLRGELVKAASTKQQSCGCSAPIKTASSIHPICSHLGVPVTQVCQDSKGRCQLLYRKRMEESFEGTSFMNSKVFI